MADDNMNQLHVSNAMEHPDCSNGPVCKRFVAQYQSRLLNKYISQSRAAAADYVPPLACLPVNEDLSGRVELSLKENHTGNGFRSLKKARRLGYTFAEFQWNHYLTDIEAINTSLPVRSGGEMRKSYLRSASELADSSAGHLGPAQKCPRHHVRSLGVFRASDSETPRLVGYIRLKRQGDLALYGQILGHGEHLRDGIMYFLHTSLIDLIVEEGLKDAPDVLIYNRWTSGGHGLQVWKKRCGFRPFTVIDSAGASVV